MPIYEYNCSQCGKTQDVLQKVDAPAPEACTLCEARGTLTKLVSRSSFVLKGGGWYSDLYGSVKKDGGKSDGGDGGSKPAASSDSGASAAPAAAAPAKAASGD
ncbi:MAG TPA: zinc ribbon domain-containing protein [Myxococcaceae bacterium]|nr:zinc ribbon domain-containing protein [Myxococcaceae bacterium]